MDNENMILEVLNLMKLSSDIDINRYYKLKKFGEVALREEGIGLDSIKLTELVSM